jgi:hypothetical protein
MLEESLLDQARLLQNFITNTMQNQYLLNQNKNQGPGQIQNQDQDQNSKIDISDDESLPDLITDNSSEDESGEDDSGDDSGEDESREDESGEEESEGEDENSIQVLNGKNDDPSELNNSDVKLVEINNLDNFEIEELHLDDDNNDSNTSSDESDTEEESQLDKNEDLEIEKESNVEILQSEENKPNFKKMSLSELKSYAEERNIIEKGKKITKKNLLLMLDQ